MPRFAGIPVEDQPKPPRFKGIPVDDPQTYGGGAQNQAVERPASPTNLDEYYSSGIFAGQYNPLGVVARSLDAATTAAGDAMTMGWGDEALGVVSQDARNIARDRQKTLRETNPVASTVGSLAGGVATGAALAPASATALLTTRASPLLGRVAAGIVDGAGAGAIYGAGSGEDAEGRIWGAVRDGTIGAVVGAGIPFISDAIGAGIRGIHNAGTNSNVAKQAGADPDALRLLGSIMDADGSLGPQGQANMARAGQEAMLVDAGPNARQLLDYTIQRGGPGTVKAQDAISQRVAREAKSFGQILDHVMGVPKGVGSAQNAIRDAARPQVSRAYDQAYKLPINYASEAGRKVENVITRIPRRIADRAIRDAMEQMAYDGIPNAQIMAQIADDGSVTLKQMPNVMQADYIKRALNGIVNDGTDAVTGRLSSDAAFAARMARDLRDALGNAVPAYRFALETAADPLSQQGAVRVGARLNALTRDEFRMAVEGMTRPEKAAVLQGFRSRIDDQMAAVTRAISDGDVDAREAIKGLRELSSRRTQENLRSVMPAGKADALFKTIDRIASTFEIRASVAQNSKTATRLAAERMVDQKTGLGVLGRAARGEPMNAGRAAAQKLTGFTDDYLRGIQDNTYSNLADILTRQGGPGQNVYDAIGQIGKTDHATELMVDRISDLLSAPRFAYPTTTQVSDRLR